MIPPYQSWKDRLYYVFVEKNSLISNEYISYVNARLEEHRSQRWRHWLVLIRLNWHYRIRRATTPLLIKNIGTSAKAKAPYMDGPESTKGNRRDPYHFAAGLMKYDVISFDIFDTLVLRKLDDPEDLFMLVGEHLNIFDFYGIRKKCEAEVRQHKRATHRNNEVTLEEIYERVAYYTGINAAQGSEIEFDIELDMCFANPYMYEVFQILKSAGKHIYATSNMYIPKEKMRVLLAKCGYEGFEDILVSCDYHCGKGNGALFRVLRSKLKSDNTIVHIGDNVGADIKGAQAAGIDAKYYVACRNLGDPHRGAGMSPLIGSAYRGVINTRLHNGTETFSEFWEYGYIYGGLIVLGYVNWLHEQTVQNGVSKILFLSRDGSILKKVFDALFDDVSSEYFFWSRISALRNICDSERQPFLERIIGERCGSGDTIRTAFEVAGIENLLDRLAEKGLSPDMPLLGENKYAIYDFLVSHWNDVKILLMNTRRNTILSLKKMIGPSTHVGIVDVGWSGRNLGPLVKIINEIGVKEENILTYMLGSICKNQNASRILSGSMRCYMFDASYNRDIHDRFCRQSVSGLEAIEKIFSATHSSFLSSKATNEMEFAEPEIENYPAFEEIGQGVLEFCQDFHTSFKKYPYLENICGYDAYIPIRLLFNNPEALFQTIGNMVYTRGVSLKDRRRINTLME